MKRKAAQRGKRTVFFNAQGYVAGTLVRYYPNKGKGKPLKKKVELAAAQGGAMFYSGVFIKLVGESQGPIKWLEQGPDQAHVAASICDLPIQHLYPAPPLPGSAAALAADSLAYAESTGNGISDLSDDNDDVDVHNGDGDLNDAKQGSSGGDIDDDEQGSDLMDLHNPSSDDFDIIVEI